MGTLGLQIYSVVIQILGVLALFCVAGAVAGIPNALSRDGAARLRGLFSSPAEPLGWALAVAAAATFGSLYLSEVVGFQPCRLCWYQRYAMYPLVVLLLVLRFGGLARLWWTAALPATIGLGISALHIYEQANPEAGLVACGTGVPCSARYVAVFGFISIPVLAGSAFLAVITLSLSTRALLRAESTPPVEA